MEKLNDELLENVSGGNLYHIIHSPKCICGYGQNCGLRKYPWIYSEGRIKSVTDLSYSGYVHLFQDKESAMRMELQCSCGTSNFEITPLYINTSDHNDLGECLEKIRAKCL